MTREGEAQIDVVRTFLSRWSVSIDEMKASFRDTLTLDAVWENVGLSRTVGPEEAVAAISAFELMNTAQRIDIEMLNIAVCGDTVLTERRDIIIGVNEKLIDVITVMGCFEISGNKIAAWRDYFDTQPFAQ